MKGIQKKKFSVPRLVLGGIIGASVFLGSIPAMAAEIKDFDSSTDYAKESIRKLAKKNIIMGDEAGRFNPHKTATRAEMITIIVRALGIDTTGISDNPTFKDVPKAHWAYRYVEAAYKAGIVKGVSNDRFGVNDECTREEMAAMFTRSLGLDDADIREKQSQIFVGKLKDGNSISNWARDYVEFVISSGLMKGSGSGTFGPGDHAKREQAAVVLDRLITNRDDIVNFSLGYIGQVQYPELYKALRDSYYDYRGELNSNLAFTITDSSSKQLEKVNVAVNGASNADNYDTNINLSYAHGDMTPVERQSRLIGVGDKIYEKVSTADVWTVKAREEFENAGAQPGSSVEQGSREKLLGSFRNVPVTKTDNQEIHGIIASRYEITLDREAAKSMLPTLLMGSQVADFENLEQSLGSNYKLTMEIYLNDKNQVVFESYSFSGTLKSAENGENITADSEFETSYSNIGADIKIIPPVQ